ncbi:MAG: hypothetical protein LBU51_00875 [Bacteroidales bacterium]|jgi:hypothetical protein|nr:hypothetical protein [Bacteroidales bacterium]
MKYIPFLSKGVLIVICLMIFTGCVSQYALQETETITFKPTVEAKGYTMIVPKGYKLGVNSGHTYSGYKFNYGKQCIEISKEGSLNWDNTPEEIDSIHNDILRNKPLFYCDTLVYSGMEKRTFWKEFTIYRKIVIGIFYPPDYRVEELNVGYRHVPCKNKEFFDSCLLSVKPLQDTTIKIDSLMIEFLYKKSEWERSKKYQRILKRQRAKYGKLWKLWEIKKESII